MRKFELIDGDEADQPPSGRLHTCDACGREGFWTPGWAWYGSYKQSEEGEPIFKACSDTCMARRQEVEEDRRKNADLADLKKRHRAAQRQAANLAKHISEMEITLGTLGETAEQTKAEKP